MEFNRLVSLVLGFVVLILLFVWITNRFRGETRTTASKTTPTVTVTKSPTPTPKEGEEKGWNPLGFLFGDDKTPTPTKAMVKKSTPSPSAIRITIAGGQTNPTGSTGSIGGSTEVVYKNNRTNVVQGAKGTSQIPETGTASIFIPSLISSLLAGVYLRKRV